MVSASDPSSAPSSADALLGAFIRAVSHDMRSPLLTMSMSAELLGGALPDDERGRLAYQGLTQGIAELERLLEAVSGISRARSRILSAEPMRLSDVLGEALNTDHSAASARIAVDPRGVAEAIAALAPEPSDIQIDLSGDHVQLSLPLPKELEDMDDDPLRKLLTSLQQYAGTAIAALAASQVQLERQGGTVLCQGGRVVLRVPLVT